MWFFSFLAAFSEWQNSEDPIILLLDEPGLGLHASAQNDLLRYIDEQLAPKRQVAYTTHSPFMVDPTKFDRTRAVEDTEGVGTQITDDVLETSKDTLFPLQAALGYELAQTLFVGPNNLVVEGASDYLYIQVMSGMLQANGRTALDSRWVIVPVGGLDKVPTFLALLSAQLNVVAIIDGKAGGNQRINSLVTKGVIEGSKILPLANVIGAKEADIEDLFDEDFYLDLVKESGAAAVEKSSLQPGDRIVRRIEQAHGGTYDHYQPARYFLENQQDLESAIGDDAFDRFEELFKQLNALL